MICAASRNFRPPYLTKGMPRRANSSSSCALWLELLNSDAPLYGGSGQGNLGAIEAVPISMHGHRHSLTLTLPPLAALFLKPESTEGGG